MPSKKFSEGPELNIYRHIIEHRVLIRYDGPSFDSETKKFNAYKMSTLTNDTNNNVDPNDLKPRISNMDISTDKVETAPAKGIGLNLDKMTP